MTDSAFMLSTLRLFPKGATTMQIIQRSLVTRGYGITPHSRAADLRRKGYTIHCDRVATHRGRPVYEYRLGDES